MSGIGFLVGYFMMYSIRSGTKTQDAFKSFLGAGALAGGAYFENYKLTSGTAITPIECGILWGAGVYFLIAIVLGVLYSFSQKGNDYPLSAPANAKAAAKKAKDSAIANQAKILAAVNLADPAAAAEPAKAVADDLATAATALDEAAALTPADKWNVYSVVLGRILLGEDFRTPAPK
jgi:hypothetical protein